jgi:protein-S-isoprenylcysteine O-methyltransferase Ste14
MATAATRGELAWQAWKGMTVFLAVTAALIFGLAGTLDYWQGWAFFSLFFALTVILSVYFLWTNPELVARRMRAGPTAEKERTQKIVQSFTSILLIASIAVSALDRRYDWSHVPAEMTIAALVAVAVGYWIMAWVMHVNRFAASTVEVTPGQEVISNGPYRYVRHPMYTGGLISFLAMPIALGSWWGIIPAVGLIFALAARLVHEESFLSQRLPGYADYLAKVRWHLVPGVW